MKRLLLFLFILSAFYSCKEEGDSPIAAPFIEMDSRTVQFTRLAASQTLRIVTNLDEVTCKVSTGTDWCKASYDDGTLTITVLANEAYQARSGVVMLAGGTLRETVSVVQDGQAASIGALNSDTKLTVKSASASSSQNGEEVEKSIDGSLSTIYHSPWTANEYMPVTLTYHFENVGVMDYLVYHPRNDGGTNGNFREVELYVSTVADATPKLYGTYDFMGSASASIVTFSPALVNPTQVTLVVKSGKGGYASCAEMEFYCKGEEQFDYATLFTDPTCSELKKGVDEIAIQAVKHPFYRDLAMEIYKGTYDREFRVQIYKAWQHPDVSAAVNKTNSYGLRDNPTGIYVNAGEDLVALVDDTHGQNLSLFVQDAQHTVTGVSMPLTEGVNRKKISVSGLVYVMYYTQTGTEKPVKINIASGKVNGYFNSNIHGANDWKRLLDKASYRHFDVIGRYASLTFETEAFRKYTPDGLALINKYDEMVRLEQEFMGLPEDNQGYKNHAYFLAIYDDASYMYATDYYMGYHVNTQSDILDLQKFSTMACWGPAHELGHVHQTRPGLRWIGMTEVTNNIHSLHIQTAWGNTSRLLTDHCYEKAFDRLLKTGKAHNEIDDVWVKLVPFWQLKLYVMDVLGKKDFYKYIYEQLRLQPDPGVAEETDGRYQLNFVKLACESAQLDLTEFFEAWGFLTPVNRSVDDYGTAQFIITRQQIEQVKAEIALKHYPKPAHDNIYYIKDDNLSDY